MTQKTKNKKHYSRKTASRKTEKLQKNELIQTNSFAQSESKWYALIGFLVLVLVAVTSFTYSQMQPKNVTNESLTTQQTTSKPKSTGQAQLKISSSPDDQKLVASKKVSQSNSVGTNVSLTITENPDLQLPQK